jgi:nucleoside-diphosphate-sugar epimerase
MKTTVVVTGANGFIGSRLMTEFAKMDLNLFQISISGKKNEYAHKMFGWSSAFPNDIRGKLIVIHAGGESSFFSSNWKHLLESNVENTRKLAIWCKKFNGRFIFLSSIGVYDRKWLSSSQSKLSINSATKPRSKYGKSKLLAEKVLTDLNLSNFQILRLPWVYGKEMRPDSHLRKFNSWKKQKNIISWLPWPGRVSVIAVEELTKLIIDIIYERIHQGETIINVGESEPANISLALSGTYIIPGARFFFFVMSRISRVMPFRIRVLLEDALVYENPANLGKYIFSNHWLKITKIWKDEIRT